MLEELHVENLLLIECARLRLAPGLNVLTGETGAGKTVLAHALDLLLGGRPRTGIVRPGASEAYVEAIFRLPSSQPLPDAAEHLLAAAEEQDAERELVLARRVGTDGRTRAYVNGRSASVADLRELGGALVAFHGQHEHRRLLSPAAQLALLDARCGERQARTLRECASEYARTRELEQRLQRLRVLGTTRARELDLLDHELTEIAQLAGDIDDYEQLRAARERLRRIDGLLGAAAAAEALLGSGTDSPAAALEQPGAGASAARAACALDALAGVDSALDALAARAGALALEAHELSSELRAYGERLQEETLDAQQGAVDSLESIEQRLAAVERLLRKHGGSPAAVREHARAAQQRREELARSESAEAHTAAQLSEARAALQAHACELRRARAHAAKPFAEAVREQLEPLAMAGAKFDVALAESELGPAGADAVELLIAPNRGVPAAPLREIASGGELSRVMLAILSVAHSREQRQTLVFDEVDAGIGGHTARAVGERVRALAEQRQLICITHLPQIASLAARHFTIVKDSDADTARTLVRELERDELVGELVRMLGADSEDSAARRHARELLRAA